MVKPGVIRTLIMSPPMCGLSALSYVNMPVGSGRWEAGALLTVCNAMLV
jgi:hypothetical protein